MTRKELGIIFIVGIVVACIVTLVKITNYDNYETRTMYVYNVIEPYTLLMDGNYQVYTLKDVNIDEDRELLVTIDNRGTEDFADDKVIKWTYKEANR